MIPVRCWYWCYYCRFGCSSSAPLVKVLEAAAAAVVEVGMAVQVVEMVMEMDLGYVEEGTGVFDCWPLVDMLDH